MTFNQILSTPITEICLTKECIKASANLIESMDTSVDPCDNFYNFACGKYIKNINLMDQSQHKSNLRSISEEITEQIRTIISSPIIKGEIKPFKLVKQFYSQCMNEVKEDVVKNLIKTLDKFGGLPFLKGDKWNETDFVWENVILELEKLQENNLLFNLTIINSENLNIFLDRPIEFPEEDNEFFMKLLFGSDLEITAFIKKIELIEKILINNSQKYKDDKNMTEMTVDEFQKKVPYFNWKNHINQLLPETIQITKNQIIQVKSLKYFQELGQFITSAPKKTIANYLLFSFVKMAGRHWEDKNMLPERWAHCLGTVHKSLQFPFSAMYILKHFDMRIRDNLKEMIEAIRNEMINTFKEAKWMEDKAQSKFLKRLEDIKSVNIGFLDELLDLVKMEKYYESLNLEKDFYSSEMLLKKWESKRKLDQISNPYSTNFMSVEMGSTTVNAFYRPGINDISKSNLKFPLKFKFKFLFSF